jgi:hypothetical protein
LRDLIPDHEVVTVPEAGWAGRRNGELLDLATGQFDAFITVDRNMPAQQGPGAGLAVIVLVARSNRLEDLTPLIPRILEALPRLRRGELVRLPA